MPLVKGVSVPGEGYWAQAAVPAQAQQDGL